MVRPLKIPVLLLSVHPLPHQGLFLLLPSHSSHVQLCATLRTAACQAPLPMGFSRQEYWSESPFALPGFFSKPGVESASPVSPALVGGFFTTVPPGKPIALNKACQIPDYQEFTFLCANKKYENI